MIYIKLEDAVDGTKFLLNIELIKTVYPAIEVGQTVIHLTDGDELIVNNPFETILEDTYFA